MMGTRVSWKFLLSFLPCLTTCFGLLVTGGVSAQSVVVDGHDGYEKVGVLQLRVLHKRSTAINATFRPDIIGKHLDELSIELKIDSEVVWMDLHLNRDLLTENYFEMHQRNGKDVIQRHTAQTVDLCHYKGKIRGRPDSWAAISTCDGIRGTIFDGQHTHHLLPTEERGNATYEKGIWPAHLVYPKNTLKRDDRSSNEGMDDSVAEKISSLQGKSRNRVKRDAGSDPVLEPYNSNKKSRYVEMIIVVDNKKFKELGGDLKKTIQRTKEVCNIVNALYTPVDIFIALVGVVVWNEVDQIPLSQNGDETLQNFLRYRRERLVDFPNDNAQLLTAVEFEKGVVGKAMQGPICSYQYSGGVNSDHKSIAGVVATTIAHELGHNFGLSHDNEKCKCDGPGERCVMSASSSSNRTSHWSSCSLEAFTLAFQHGMDYCLRNVPKKLFEGPVCGNGFTEPGEQCDCGIHDFCTNPCCNAETCTLHSNATCGAGPCCDLETCHVKPGGTVCRGANNACDLPEYCTGEGEHCPVDTYKINGDKCKTPYGEAYCYEGKCRTHTDQCRLLWGPSGNSSHNLCYQKNNNGTRYGNCGYNLVNKTYTPCRTEDVKCGLLHCRYYQEKLEFGYEPVAIMSSFFVHSQENVFPCRSVTVDFGLQDVDPGLVPDGAKCGNDKVEKMCVNQKCVAVSSVIGGLHCPDDCNGRGVCNNKGHCHCDDGYGGASCSKSGFGGSIDSGPSVNPLAASMFAKALYVTFVGFIPLIAIISFYVYYAKENFTKAYMYIRTFGRTTKSNNKRDRGPGGSGIPTSDTSSSISASSGNNNSKQVHPDDFFGSHKGFTLAPLKKPDSSANGSQGATSDSTTSKKPEQQPNGFGNHSSSIQSSTNSNVYYSPVPTHTVNEVLVKNRNDERPSLKSYTNNLIQRGMSRVSWAQPVAQPLPTSSPTSEDEVNTSIGIYENTNGQSEPKSPAHAANPVPPHDDRPFARLYSVVPTSKLSKLAGAFPFMRNSMRLNSGTEQGGHAKTSNGKKGVEISMPILKNKAPDPPGSPKPGFVSATVLKLEDEIDHSSVGGNKFSPTSRYANVPMIDESPSKEIANEIPRLPSVLTGSRPQRSTDRKPVLRAHSMIQSNKTSLHTSNNPNFNSLRRNRPTVPPPKPPEVPPPPPPVAAPEPVPKARSESPPADRAPKTVLRPVINPSNFSSILKMSLNRNNSRSSPPLRPEPPKAPKANANHGSRSNINGPLYQDKQNDNIYDEIADTRKEPPSAEEKVETLSTGSADSGGGLLSEIIMEIQSRNHDSIYNTLSIDRRKKKLEELEKKNQLSFAAKDGYKKASPKSSPKGSPRASPKFKYKPAVPTYQPKQKPADPSVANVINDSMSKTNGGGVRSRSNSPLSSTPTPVAYKSASIAPPPLPSANPVPVLPGAGPIKRPSSPTLKPTCAVNGIPKIASSPSYVAKINYFTSPGSNKTDSPMKPINSLNSAIGDGSKSISSDIYAPSNVSGPEQTHLSTIRPTYARPYVSKMTNGSSSQDGTESSRLSGASSSSGEYGTIGRNRGRKLSTEEKPAELKPSPPKEEQQGYKPFNPYLNRPLTFSTFRPQKSPTTSANSTNNTTSMSGTQSLPRPDKSSLLYTKPILVMDTGKNSVRPPLTIGLNRSPARVAQ